MMTCHHRAAYAAPLAKGILERECMGIEPTESFVQTPHWF
jgi:hypothetical protein